MTDAKLDLKWNYKKQNVIKCFNLVEFEQN